MTEHADRIWAAAQVLNEVAETEDQSGAINDLLAVANALRSTPAAPQSIRDALYDLRTHSHQPPNGADMPIEYVAFRDVEDLLSRAAALRSTPAAPQPCCTDATGMPVPCQHPAAPESDTALTVDRLARARATDGGWKEPNVTDRKWAEQFLAILRALGEGVGE